MAKRVHIKETSLRKKVILRSSINVTAFLVQKFDE